MARTPTHPTGVRCTAAESALRVSTIYGLLTKGQSRGEITQFCSENYKINQCQTDAYLKKARELIEKDCELSRPQFLGEALGRLRKIEQAACKRGQLMTAVASVKLQCQLIGLVDKSAS